MFHNVHYVNSLQGSLTVQSVEVSSRYLGFQYPAVTLQHDPIDPDASFFFGTLSYDPSEEYKACKTLLCHVLPAKHAYGTSLGMLPQTPSATMLQRRVKQKSFHEKVIESYESETLA